MDKVERHAGRIVRHYPALITAELFLFISRAGDKRVLHRLVMSAIQEQVGERTPPQELRRSEVRQKRNNAIETTGQIRFLSLNRAMTESARRANAMGRESRIPKPETIGRTFGNTNNMTSTTHHTPIEIRLILVRECIAL